MDEEFGVCYDENGPYFDPYAGCYEDEEDDLEYWINECGQGSGYVGCLKAGSEECDFECPFSRELYTELTRLQMLERWVMDKLPWPFHAWRNLMISQPGEIYSDAEEFYCTMSRAHNVYSTPWDRFLNAAAFYGSHEKILYDELPF